MPPRTFRKRPVEIKAWQINTDDYDELCDIAAWCGGGWSEDSDHALLIFTLEGVMGADNGDWIIKGVNNEFYPCKDEIFKKTYEFVWG